LPSEEGSLFFFSLAFLERLDNSEEYKIGFKKKGEKCKVKSVMLDLLKALPFISRPTWKKG
jgi:hypothetical protein